MNELKNVYDDVEELKLRVTALEAQVATLQSTQPTDSGWIDLPLTAGITHHSTTNFPCRYRKIGNRVRVEGAVVGITAVNTVVATLPEGFRPSKSFYNVTPTNAGKTDIFNVRNNGEIKLMNTQLEALYADQYHFITAEFMVD